MTALNDGEYPTYPDNVRCGIPVINPPTVLYTVAISAGRNRNEVRVSLTISFG